MTQEKGAKARATYRSDLVAISTVEMKPIKWLWPGRIPIGMLTIVEGPPKRGKSLVMLDIIARLTTGRAMPGCEASPVKQALAIIVNPEDPIPSVVGPRLEAAGADRDRVFLHRGFVDTDAQGREARRGIVLNEECVARLKLDIIKVGARLVVIDAVMGLLPANKSSNSDQETRAVLEPLARLAENLNISLVIGRHWSKGAPGRPSFERGLGSIAFTGVARSVLQVGHYPGDKARRVIGVGASNGLDVDPWEFRIVGRQVDLPADAGHAPGSMDAPVVEWIGPLKDFDLEELERRPPDDAAAGPTREQACATWLQARLEELGGEAPSASLEAQALTAGFHESTFKRARLALRDQGALFSRREGSGWRIIRADAHHVERAREVFD